MSPSGWLAIAAAITLLAPRRVAVGRIAVLAGAGRLSGLAEPVLRPRLELGPLRAAGVALVAVTVAVLIAGGVLLAGAAAAAAAAAWVLVRDGVARKQQTVRRRDLRLGLRVLIGELEAGARPSIALAAAGEAAPSYAEVFAKAARAAADSADAGAAFLTQPETRPIGLAWQLGADTGTALAAVLDRVAADLHAEQEHRHTVETVLAGPRASALLLAGLPLVGIALGAAMGARPLSVLTGTVGGQLLCLAGVVLDVAGLLWMRRLLGRAEAA
jgi:tight adherence protein B